MRKEKELEELPGVGATTAKAVIDFREKSGQFHRLEGCWQSNSPRLGDKAAEAAEPHSRFRCSGAGCKIFDNSQDFRSAKILPGGKPCHHS